MRDVLAEKASGSRVELISAANIFTKFLECLENYMHVVQSSIPKAGRAVKLCG